MQFTVEQISDNPLSTKAKKALTLLVPSRFRSCLEGQDPDGISDTKIFSFTADNNGKIEAVALFGLNEDIGLAELYCFSVKDPNQFKDIGDKLLELAEKTLFSNGALVINHYFRGDEPTTNLLKKRLWAEPKLFMTRFFFEAFTFHPPWFDLPPEYPKGYQEFPWKKLKKKERDILLKQYEQGHFPNIISPFHNENEIEPLTSLGLRYKKEVIGWMINHKIAPDTLQYSAFFIKSDYRHTGISMRLLVNSMKLQQQSPIKWALFEVKHDEQDKTWNKIVSKRLAPYAIEIDQIYQTWKAASPEVFKFSY